MPASGVKAVVAARWVALREHVSPDEDEFPKMKQLRRLTSVSVASAAAGGTICVHAPGPHAAREDAVVKSHISLSSANALCALGCDACSILLTNSHESRADDVADVSGFRRACECAPATVLGQHARILQASRTSGCAYISRGEDVSLHRRFLPRS